MGEHLDELSIKHRPSPVDSSVPERCGDQPASLEGDGFRSRPD